jgi:hypothetical protein
MRYGIYGGIDMKYIIETTDKQPNVDIGTFIKSRSSGDVYLIIDVNLGYTKYALLDMTTLIISSFSTNIENMLDNKLEDGYKILKQSEPIVLTEEE